MTRSVIPLARICLTVLTTLAGAAPLPAPAPVPVGENAATWYRRAFEVLPDTANPDWAILEHPDAVRLDAPAIEFIRKHDPTFELLRKGAACRQCDWGTDPKEGADAGLPHLTGARTLASLTRLRARLLFQQRRHADAMDDVTALLTLSRHVGTEPFIMSKLIEAGVADSAVMAAAQGVATAPPDVARALMDKLERLPNSLPPADVVRRTGEWAVAEVRRSSGEGGAAAEVAALFDEASGHLTLPFEQSFVPVQRWETKRAAASEVARKAVPSLRTYRVAVAAAETRVQMLYVAAAVRADGRREVFRFNEPHAKGPFTYHELPGGFELESKLVLNNLPLKLTCKPAGDEIPF